MKTGFVLVPNAFILRQSSPASVGTGRHPSQISSLKCQMQVHQSPSIILFTEKYTRYLQYLFQKCLIVLPRDLFFLLNSFYVATETAVSRALRRLTVRACSHHSDNTQRNEGCRTHNRLRVVSDRF